MGLPEAFASRLMPTLDWGSSVGGVSAVVCWASSVGEGPSMARVNWKSVRWGKPVRGAMAYRDLVLVAVRLLPGEVSGGWVVI